MQELLFHARQPIDQLLGQGMHSDVSYQCRENQKVGTVSAHQSMD